MSMLLMIYSICNMHVVSWGTRESATAVDPTAKAPKKPDSKLQVGKQTLSHKHRIHITSTVDARSISMTFNYKYYASLRKLYNLSILVANIW